MKVHHALLICITLLSCSKDYYSVEDFDRIKKIDTHIHLNGENTALTEQARADNFHLLTVNVDVADYVSLDDQERFAWHQIQQFPDDVDYITAFTLSNWNSEQWADSVIARIRKSFDKGALGIKLWKNIGMVEKNASSEFIMIDDPKFDPVIRYIIDQDKTLMAHLGEPKNCWLPLEQMTVNNDRKYFKENPQYHMYLHPEFPSYEQLIDARDRFVEKYPDMRFVGAHLGSLEWDVNELAKRLDKFPNMAVDMAARIPHLQYQSRLDREKVREFFIKYQDRLIYATDAGISEDSDAEKDAQYTHQVWLDDWKYFTSDEMLTSPNLDGEFQGLKLPKEVIDKIYRENAIHWFRIK